MNASRGFMLNDVIALCFVFSFNEGFFIAAVFF